MKYYIGIDGGGTKTAAIIWSEDGREAIITLPGSNNSYTGMEVSLGIIKKAVLTLTADIGADLDEVAGIFVGIAGATANDYINICSEMLRNLLPNAVVGVDVDAMNLLTMLEGDGAALICGTGSICFARKDGEFSRIGGYADFDSSGSGTHMGKDALMLSLFIHDGRRKNSLLNDLVEEKLGAKVLKSIPMLMKAERSYIASFARLVFYAAENGDSQAMEILEHNFKYLAGLIDRASEILGMDEYPLVTGGGILRDTISEELLKRFAKSNPIITYYSDQSRGALHMAKKLAGWK